MMSGRLPRGSGRGRSGYGLGTELGLSGGLMADRGEGLVGVIFAPLQD